MDSLQVLKSALALPREREKLIRLETQLLRLLASSECATQPTHRRPRRPPPAWQHCAPPFRAAGASLCVTNTNVTCEEEEAGKEEL